MNKINLSNAAIYSEGQKSLVDTIISLFSIIDMYDPKNIITISQVIKSDLDNTEYSNEEYDFIYFIHCSRLMVTIIK